MNRTFYPFLLPVLYFLADIYIRSEFIQRYSIAQMSYYGLSLVTFTAFYLFFFILSPSDKEQNILEKYLADFLVALSGNCHCRFFFFLLFQWVLPQLLHLRVFQK